jgi:hypothetical protein
VTRTTCILAFTRATPFAAFAQQDQRVGEKLGTVSFDTSCTRGVKAGFNREIALLHSFEVLTARILKCPATTNRLLSNNLCVC